MKIEKQKSDFLNFRDCGKEYKVKRLFYSDAEKILEIYKDYDRTFFNPVNPDFVKDCMSFGEFWGVYEGKGMKACAYFMPADCPPFKDSGSGWECRDLLRDEFSRRALCGYIALREGTKEGEKNIMFKAILRFAAVYAEKKDLENVIYCAPVKLYCPLGRLFESGFLLRGLRGLDNAVANYIFTCPGLKGKKGKVYSEDVKIKADDTKILSMRLEHGYVGHRLTDKNEIILGR